MADPAFFSLTFLGTTCPSQKEYVSEGMMLYTEREVVERRHVKQCMGDAGVLGLNRCLPAGWYRCFSGSGWENGSHQEALSGQGSLGRWR